MLRRGTLEPLLVSNTSVGTFGTQPKTNRMNKQVSSAAVAVLFAVLVRIGFSIAPVVLRAGDANMSVTCGEVKAGMTFSEMNEVLHRRNRYGYEVFNGSDEFAYYGNGGMCRIAIDPKSGQVTNAAFSAPNWFDLRAMSP
jgi:hypothetical protein